MTDPTLRELLELQPDPTKHTDVVLRWGRIALYELRLSLGLPRRNSEADLISELADLYPAELRGRVIRLALHSIFPAVMPL